MQNTLPINSLLYKESKDSQGVVISADIFFIDTPYDGEAQYMTTWLVSYDLYDGNESVITDIRSGGMPTQKAQNLVDATEDHIEWFLNKKMNLDARWLEYVANWVVGIQTLEDMESLVQSEKDRIITIVDRFVSNNSNSDEYSEYKKLILTPYNYELEEG